MVAFLAYSCVWYTKLYDAALDCLAAALITITYMSGNSQRPFIRCDNGEL